MGDRQKPKGTAKLDCKAAVCGKTEFVVVIPCGLH